MGNIECSSIHQYVNLDACHVAQTSLPVDVFQPRSSAHQSDPRKIVPRRPRPHSGRAWQVSRFLEKLRFHRVSIVFNFWVTIVRLLLGSRGFSHRGGSMLKLPALQMTCFFSVERSPCHRSSFDESTMPL